MLTFLLQVGLEFAGRHYAGVGLLPVALGDEMEDERVMALAVAGLITMYSSGYANGARFWDHLRNLSLAFVIMVLVAQIPPQRLMTFAVPVGVKPIKVATKLGSEIQASQHPAANSGMALNRKPSV